MISAGYGINDCTSISESAQQQECFDAFGGLNDACVQASPTPEEVQKCQTEYPTKDYDPTDSVFIMAYVAADDAAALHAKVKNFAASGVWGDAPAPAPAEEAPAEEAPAEEAAAAEEEAPAEEAGAAGAAKTSEGAIAAAIKDTCEEDSMCTGILEKVAATAMEKYEDEEYVIEKYIESSKDFEDSVYQDSGISKSDYDYIVSKQGGAMINGTSVLALWAHGGFNVGKWSYDNAESGQDPQGVGYWNVGLGAWAGLPFTEKFSLGVLFGYNLTDLQDYQHPGTTYADTIGYMHGIKVGLAPSIRAGENGNMLFVPFAGYKTFKADKIAMGGLGTTSEGDSIDYDTEPDDDDKVNGHDFGDNHGIALGLQFAYMFNQYLGMQIDTEFCYSFQQGLSDYEGNPRNLSGWQWGINLGLRFDLGLLNKWNKKGIMSVKTP